MGTFWVKASLPFWLLVYILLVILSLDHIFFWDTVQLASKQAHHFYEGSMWQFLLPDEIDSGHLPFMGWMLAWCWKVLGKSLMVSHLMMLPWVVALVFQVHVFSKNMTTGIWVPVVAGLLLLDPTLMAQCSLVSPDVILMVGFLIMVNGSWVHKNTVTLLGALFCVLASNRGAMVVAAVVVWQALVNWERGNSGLRSQVKSILPFLPAIGVFIAFQVYHLASKSWIGYHDASPWAASFDRVSGMSMLKNIALIGWRMADFGRWLFLLILGLRCLQFFHQCQRDRVLKSLLLLWASLALFLLPSMVLHTGLTGHRYLLPLIVVFLAITAKYVSLLPSFRYQQLLLIAAAFSLLTGHCWIYPKGVAQGWDASLAHWPYFELRSKMEVFLDKKGIRKADVASAFPNLAERKYLDLSDSKEKHALKDLKQNEYFLYSNIYNEVTEADYHLLESNFIPIYTLENNGVCMVLYRRK